MILLRRWWRLSYLISIGCFLLIFLAFVDRSRFIARLLYEDGSPYIIDPTIIIEPSKDYKNSTGSQLIPKIIHQTYINTSIPDKWRQGQENCKVLHPDYAYMFWTDELAFSFIANNYPWFLHTYASYPYPIQRVDALRYFLLYHYGGIYLDLDIESHRRLDPLLSYPAWGCRTAPIGISNDALGAVPGHPFYLTVINSLEAYNRELIFPYMTIMYSTGPLFLSVIWEEYINMAHPENELFWVLSRDTHYEATYGFFYNHTGSSWHEWDARFIFWLYRHLLLVLILGVSSCFGLIAALCYWMRRTIRKKRNRMIERTD